MYQDSGYKLAHAQSVCTRPFSLHREGPGDEAITDWHYLVAVNISVAKITKVWF